MRLGHPGISPAPDGVVDLSGEPDSALLQAYAVARSRFMIATPSGPLAFAHSFHCDVAIVNAVDLWNYNPNCVVRTIDVIEKDGSVTRQEGYLKKNYTKLKVMELMAAQSVECRQNDAASIRDVAERMIEKTAGGNTWRPLPHPPNPS